MSLEITPRMKYGNRIPAGTRLPQTVFQRPCSRPSHHTPNHPSSIRLNIPFRITPRMKYCNRIPAGTRLLQAVFRRPYFRPSHHTPNHPSSIRLNIPFRICPLTLIPLFQPIPPPLRQRATFNGTLSQWSERRRGDLCILPLPHIHTTPRPSRGESAKIRNEYGSWTRCSLVPQSPPPSNKKN